jgi:hypothetical protein
MKLLLDQNISFRIIALIKEHFPDCRSVKELDLWDKKRLRDLEVCIE